MRSPRRLLSLVGVAAMACSCEGEWVANTPTAQPNGQQTQTGQAPSQQSPTPVPLPEGPNYSFEYDDFQPFELFNADATRTVPMQAPPDGQAFATVTATAGTYFSIGTASGALSNPGAGRVLRAGAWAQALSGTMVGATAQIIIRERDAAGNAVGSTSGTASSLSPAWLQLQDAQHVVLRSDTALDVRVRFGGSAGNVVGVDFFDVSLAEAPTPPEPPAPAADAGSTPTPPQPQPQPPSQSTLFDRPFPLSAVYQPIPASEPTHSNSAAMVQAFVATGKVLNRSDGPRRWQGKTSDPVWSCGPNGVKMYAPQNIVGSGGADDTIEIYNDVTPNNGPARVVRLWGGDSVALNIDRTAHTIRGATIGVADPTGNGKPLSGAGTAWGLFSAVGVYLHKGDYVQGEIDHAVGAALGLNLLAKGQFMAPALGQEFKATGSLIPMGARFQYVGPPALIDQVVDASGLKALGLDQFAKQYYRAAAKYGVIIRDGTGNNGLGIYADVTPDWSQVSTHPYWGDVFRKTTELWKPQYWRVPQRSAY